MKQQKTYIVFLNDESGSMHSLTSAAIKDYNAIIDGVKTSATKHEQDTIVSSFAFGQGEVRRKVVNSNPHVLKPLTVWTASGGTPGREAIKEAINLLKAMPDYNSPDVAFAVFTTTDGEFDGDRYGGISTAALAGEISDLSRSGRWTFVFRVPEGGSRHLSGLGIPAGNIQEWETTAAGLERSTAQTAQAVDTFFATRASGQKSSTVFYADAAAVDTSKLKDISKAVSLYVVDSWDNGIQIRDFILKKRMKYLKGSAFYQLTKTEARVSPSKMIAIRDRANGKVYAGKEARDMLGLSSVNNIRLHPGDHGNYDLFIQSESVNRKLVGGTGVLYWEEIGVEFTQDEITRYTTPAAPKPAAPAVVQLPAVTPTNKPTPSPLKPTLKAQPTLTHTTGIVNGAGETVTDKTGRVRFHQPSGHVEFYATRDIARAMATAKCKKQYDAGPNAPTGQRFYIA